MLDPTLISSVQTKNINTDHKRTSISIQNPGIHDFSFSHGKEF